VGGERKRIGFLRLKSEVVLKYDHTPRWLHFNPIDLNNESPGSILINLQFVVESSTVKRVLKERGLDKNFKLCAHIIQGFDFDPTNKDRMKNEYTVEVFMDSNSITSQSGIINNTKRPSKKIFGDFPFYNEVVLIDPDLDLKLDFAPDVVVRLKNKDEEIGIFTVPIRSIRKKNENDYPHYFNFIRNNKIVGRLLAMFFITSSTWKKKNPKEEELKKCEIFKLYKKLQVKKKATIKVFVHGIRDMDFIANYEKCELKVRILSNSAEDNQNQEISASAGNKATVEVKGAESHGKLNKIEHIIKPEDIINLNTKDRLNYINICQVFEFETYVYGDPKGLETNDDDDASLTIFPMIKFELISKNSFLFPDDERFLLMDTCEFYPSFSEKTKLKYKKIFEDNLSTKTIDQEQRLIDMKAATSGSKKKNENEQQKNDEDQENNEEENLLLKNTIAFKEKPENKNEAAAPLGNKPVTQKEINDFIVKYEKFDFHKFLDITTEDCICLKHDKEKEREAKRKLIKIIKANLDELRKRENVIIYILIYS